MPFTNGKVDFAEIVDLVDLLARIDNSFNVLPYLGLNILLQGASAHDLLAGNQSDERRVCYRRVGDVRAKGFEIAPLIAPACDGPRSGHHIRGYATPGKLTREMLKLII